MALCALAAGAAAQAGAAEVRLIPSVPQPGAMFGQSLAVRGDLLVAGASDTVTGRAGAGAAYVFAFDPVAGTWTEQARLVSPNPRADGYFGAAVATDGTRVVVGAPGEERAYVFERDAAGAWTRTATFTPPSGSVVHSGFGRAVAVSGAHLAVGANTCVDCLNGQAGIGAVVMYRHDGTHWVEVQRLSAEGGSGAPTLLGLSVALDGNTLLAGDAFGEPASTLRTGAALVWEYSTTDGWRRRATLFAQDGGFGDLFGLSVALDGDTAVVAAPDHAHEASATGAVYVFARNAGAWAERPVPVAELRPLDASNLPRPPVGPVAVSGNRLLVGAPERNGSTGGAYLFTRSAGVWPLDATPVAHTAVAGSRFGYAVAVSADHLVAGALDEKQGQGAVYAHSPAPSANGGSGSGNNGGRTVGGGGGGTSGDPAALEVPAGCTVGGGADALLAGLLLVALCRGAWRRRRL